MCSTSEILNDSKEPRRRRFDKKAFLITQIQITKIQILPTQKFWIFLFLYFGLNLYLLRLSAPTENKTWMLF